MYRLGSLLGSGRYSEVRIAESKNGDKYAVKCIKLGLIRSEMHLVRREVEILKHVKHLNIIQFVDSYEDLEFLYLVLEFCDGGNLRDKINHCGKLDESQARAMARGVLQALVYLHNKNICHRDIKPENILFTSSGAVKLADFGLARYLSGVRQVSIVGTPYYMAPEVMKGQYDCKCDIWSCGVVVHYAVTGSLPFQGDNTSEWYQEALHVKVSPSCGETCKAFISRLLEPDVEKRVSATEALDLSWLNE